jgi:mannitol 2-dehydrogenase
VIEDAFCAGRPDWDRAGATFSDRVHDYETMKLRILNAGHQLLANAGEILTVETIAGCMAHPAIAAFLGRTLRTEIAPHVAPTPDMTPEAYIALIERRFANPAVVDTVRRVAFDGSSRHPGFLLPIVRDALAVGAPVAGLALAEALWARMCAGLREDGSAIEPNDPQWDALSRAALAARETPAAWLAQRSVYGDLGDSPAFAEPFSRWLRRIWSDGAEAALRDYAAGA